MVNGIVRESVRQVRKEAPTMIKYIAIPLIVVCLAACASIGRAFDDDESIALSEVPAKVKEAAQNAVDGIVLTESEVEEEDGQLVYELEGKVDGKEYEIEVTADGQVLEIEEEDEDDDDDDDDDDD